MPAQVLVDGGIGVMSLITLLFILMIIAIWQAPNWIKEIGIAALVISVLLPLINWIRTLGVAMTVNGEISHAVLVASFRSSAIALAYGLTVYLVSVVCRMLKKSRKGSSHHSH